MTNFLNHYTIDQNRPLDPTTRNVLSIVNRVAIELDPVDLYRIISTYADAGNMDRLYEDEIDLLEEVGHDLELAGAALLGLDARRLCSPATAVKLRELFVETDFAEKIAERIRVSRFPLDPERLGRVYQQMSRFTEQLIQ
jgi:predicted nucleotidyltransferase